MFSSGHQSYYADYLFRCPYSCGPLSERKKIFLDSAWRFLSSSQLLVVIFFLLCLPRKRFFLFECVSRLKITAFQKRNDSLRSFLFVKNVRWLFACPSFSFALSPSLSFTLSLIYTRSLFTSFKANICCMWKMLFFYRSNCQCSLFYLLLIQKKCRKRVVPESFTTNNEQYKITKYQSMFAYQDICVCALWYTQKCTTCEFLLHLFFLFFLFVSVFISVVVSNGNRINPTEIRAVN